MAEYLANAAQTVALNSPVLFTASIPCSKGYVYHEDETGIFTLRGVVNNPSSCFARSLYSLSLAWDGKGTKTKYARSFLSMD